MAKTGWYSRLVLQPILAEHFVGKFGCLAPSSPHLQVWDDESCGPGEGKVVSFSVSFSHHRFPILRKQCP